MTVKQIRFIEELAANAWPAETIQIVDGWWLRFNHDVSRRANSVWPNENGGRVPLELRLTLAEAFYARRGLPVRYQICPACLPVGLDDVLEARGYTVDAPTAVQIADTSIVLARTMPPPPAGTEVRGVSAFEALTDVWFDTYLRSEGHSERVAAVRKKLLGRIGPRQVYVLIEVGGEPVAVGRGVLERGWVGVFGMSTRPEFRRQGCATAILHVLAKWGKKSGAANMYLQVMENNPGAKALYAMAGFERLYHYHYRQSPHPRRVLQ
ncbi:MAG: GNAT family N-acetyltransferase [Anaerolineales bacterium]